MRIFILITLIFIAAFGCKENHYETVNQNDALYFPLTAQSVWIDSIKRIEIDVPSAYYDTTKQTIKTIVDSIQHSSDTQKIYCTKYRYNKDNGKWETLHPYWFERTNKQLIRFENNKIYLDMVFPLSNGKIWNTYAYHILSDTSIRNTVEKINVPEIINGEYFDSTLTIHHRMDSTLIYKYTDVSKYAKNIGFLKRESVSIISDDPDYDYTLPIEERIKKATFITTKRSYIKHND